MKALLTWPASQKRPSGVIGIASRRSGHSPDWALLAADRVYPCRRRDSEFRGMAWGRNSGMEDQPIGWFGTRCPALSVRTVTFGSGHKAIRSNACLRIGNSL